MSTLVPVDNLLLASLGAAVDHLKPHLSSEVFTAGQVLKQAGEEFGRVYFPTGGLISSRVVLVGGQEVECALIGNTNAIGLLSALGFPSGISSYICITDGRAWSIPLAQLRFAAREHVTIQHQLTRFCFAQMGYTAHLGICNAMHTADQRLARWLGTAAKLLGACEIPVSQDELARILGLQRTAVNPALGRLKDRKVVEVSRGRVHILDHERLSRAACECLPGLSRALSSDNRFLTNDSEIAPV